MTKQEFRELTEQGIVLVNELPLEEYLYAVVPSEMPASYPQEALKAQAVCARTYAYRYILRAGIPELGAHVDDTTAYQVYHNIEEHAASTTAVKETDGVLLTYEGEAAGNYYYSTSCGTGTDVVSWQGGNGEEVPYLQGVRVSGVHREERAEQESKDADDGSSADGEERTGDWKPDAQNGAEGAEQPGARQTDGFDAESLRDEAVFRQFITTVHETDFAFPINQHLCGHHISEFLHDKILLVVVKIAHRAWT